MDERNADISLIYGSWMDIAFKIGGREKQSELIMSLIRYSFYGECPEYAEGSAEAVFFEMARPLIDADKKRKRGGAPKGNTNACKKQPAKTTSKQPIETTSKQTTSTSTSTSTSTCTCTIASASPTPGGAGQQTKKEKNSRSAYEKETDPNYMGFIGPEG